MKKINLLIVIFIFCIAPIAAQNLPRLRVSSNGHYLQTTDGKPFFYISNPALGLWADKAKF